MASRKLSQWNWVGNQENVLTSPVDFNAVSIIQMNGPTIRIEPSRSTA